MGLFLEPMYGYFSICGDSNYNNNETVKTDKIRTSFTNSLD